MNSKISLCVVYLLLNLCLTKSHRDVHLFLALGRALCIGGPRNSTMCSEISCFLNIETGSYKYTFVLTKHVSFNRANQPSCHIDIILSRGVGPMTRRCWPTQWLLWALSYRFLLTFACRASFEPSWCQLSRAALCVGATKQRGRGEGTSRRGQWIIYLRRCLLF